MWVLFVLNIMGYILVCFGSLGFIIYLFNFNLGESILKQIEVNLSEINLFLMFIGGAIIIELYQIIKLLK